MKSNKKTFDELIEEAKNDPNIIGFFLNGSRGKNKATEHSDYDSEIIVKDRVAEIYKDNYKKRNKPPFGFRIFSISEFRKYADIGSPFEWDRASYTHVKTIIDKTGEIQKLIDEKGNVPKDKIKKQTAGHLDGYINHIYRSLKCFRDNNIVGARLEAARSVHDCIEAIFSLEGRATPYYKYLEWELKKHPLKKFPMKQKEFIKTLFKILENANIKTQQKLFSVIEKMFRKEGYSSVFDDWEYAALKLIREFKK